MSGIEHDDTVDATLTSPFRRKHQARAHGLRATDPDLVGRYRIERRLGEGGMGVVYVAHDPELARDVAVKVVHPRRDADASAADRLLREARALARLSHPNVVDVYDAGRCGDGVYIAMELVLGQSLQRWLAVDRKWTEIVDVFVGAALGLAAAHEAGIIHRDFKPANVIVGDDGVVRVLDFGLARAAGPWRGGTAPVELDGRSLTGTGSVVGTPAYMAPEQLANATLDGRTDQFSFCVALYEALWGTRPWHADSWPALADAILTARVPVPPRTRRRSRLFAIVRRGLARDPADRHPDMLALVAALRSIPRRRRPPVFLVGAVLGAAAIAIAWPDTAEPCDPAPRLAKVWNDDTRSAITNRFDASEAEFADASHARVQARLDDYATQWSGAYVDLCGGDAQTLDLHMRCLDGRLGAFAAIVGVLGELEPDELLRADGIVEGLPAVETCRDREALERYGTDVATAAIAAELATLERDDARADALTGAGRAPDALAVAERAVAMAEALGLDTAIAQANTAHGNALKSLGRFAEARDAYERAFVAAAASDDDRKAFALASALVFVHGVSLGRRDEAQRWIEQAEALLQRSTHEAIELGQFHNNVGAVLAAAGELDAARERHHTALALLEAEYGGDHLSVAHTLGAIASVTTAQGRDEEAETMQRRAIAIQTAALGEAHPVVAEGYNGLGRHLNQQRRYADAEAAFRRAYASLAAAYGEDNNRAMVPLSNLGQVLTHLGRTKEAKETLERARAVQERELGRDHRETIVTTLALAHHHQQWGDRDEAERLLVGAVGALERVKGPEHADAALALNSLGALYATEGYDERGLELFERVLAIRQRTLPPDHPWIAAAHYNIAVVLNNMRRWSDAIPHYEASIRIGELDPEADASGIAAHRIGLGSTLVAAGETTRAIEVLRETLPQVEREALRDPWFERQLADGRFALARAIAKDDPQSTEALELATAARDYYQVHTEHPRHHLERIQTWLSGH